MTGRVTAEPLEATVLRNPLNAPAKVRNMTVEIVIR